MAGSDHDVLVLVMIRTSHLDAPVCVSISNSSPGALVPVADDFCAARRLARAAVTTLVSGHGLGRSVGSMAGPSRGLAWLDWLRFGAAFAVLFDHTKQFSLVPYGDLPPAQQGLAVEALFAATRLGQPAVVLFFVISGYLVGGRLLEKLRAGEFDLPI